MNALFRLALGVAVLPLLAAGVLSPTPDPAAAGGSAYIAIDADPSDGCGTLQGSRFVTTGTPVSVGICLMNSASPPASGLISGARLGITYISPLTASDVADDGTTDLDANPDWNQASLGGDAAWDCNVLNDPASAPSANPSPATITCESVGGVDRAVSGDALLATLTFNAPSSTGTSPLILDNIELSLGDDPDASCNFGIICIGASIIVQPGTPTPVSTSTNTPTNTNTPINTNTPTSTNSPTPVNTSTPTPSPTPCTSNGTPVTCPTATPTRTTTQSDTHTPTRTGTAASTGTATTAASTTSPVAPGTQPSGSAGAGGQQPVRLPDTGSTGSSARGSSYLLLTLGVGAATLLGAGMLVTTRRRR